MPPAGNKENTERSRNLRVFFNLQPQARKERNRFQPAVKKTVTLRNMCVFLFPAGSERMLPARGPQTVTLCNEWHAVYGVHSVTCSLTGVKEATGIEIQAATEKSAAQRSSSLQPK